MKTKISIAIFLMYLVMGCSQKKEKQMSKKEETSKTEAKRSLNNPFFVFNNALNKNVKPLPWGEQAALIKALGYDGSEGRETDGLLEMMEAFQKENLDIFTNYVKIDIDEEPHYQQKWKSILPRLKGSEMILWVHIHSKKYRPSEESADEKIIPILRELADLVKPYGLRVAIYPHARFLAEKAEDSYRIARKVDRDNVGAVFNLCHFLKTDDEENLEGTLLKMLPKLFAVSISGADGGATQKMEWNRVIQPLGQGDFDTYRVVEFLADHGYKGPIGLQCYNIKTPPKVHLEQSMRTWQLFKKRYQRLHNTLTDQEKKEGWRLLFNGKTTEQWRGINKKTFPDDGWKVTNGELVADLAGGGESDAVGDIITKEKYGNFILEWDWQMKTKGGNSGLKYFVQEGLGENKGYGYGLEYQILDDKNHSWMLNGKMTPNDYHTVGSLYEIYAAAADKRPSPLGLWNTSKIVSKGRHVEHWLNGKKVLEYDRDSDDFKARIAVSKFKDIKGFGLQEQGHLLLQDHGSVVHFRNIKIKPIDR